MGLRQQHRMNWQWIILGLLSYRGDIRTQSQTPPSNLHTVGCAQPFQTEVLVSVSGVLSKLTKSRAADRLRRLPVWKHPPRYCL